MRQLIDIITDEVTAAFEACGYEVKYGRVTLSNRPDLCEYQCNGAMAAAKSAHCAPFLIAEKVAQCLQERAAACELPLLEMAECVKPGFLNLKVSGAYLAEYMNQMKLPTFRYGVEKAKQPLTIIVDYGGANVAKPLHVGHLRSAIIGESVKRIARFMGHTVVGDVHLGDWGLQMGLVITELAERKPDLVYFDADYEGEYPKEAPFTIAELEEIYPTASGRSKEDEAYKARALQATYELQHGRRGYRAIWQHILNVSVSDLKRNYEKLNVEFDLWKGESDADPYIPDMVQKMKDDGYAYISDGALVVDVREETDTKEIPPCMILKSDGAALYNTTDLATMVWRMADYHPDMMIYLTDKRHELYFTQVFRRAKKTGIVDADTQLRFLGFGTMNGKDGKPFKTRQGGVMRLEYLLDMVNEEMMKKIAENEKSRENADFDEEAAKETAETIALAAIKYGDLSNQASKDYVFDVDRFTSFEGNTGPYILYTIVRIKSILAKQRAMEEELEAAGAANGAAASGDTDSMVTDDEATDTWGGVASGEKADSKNDLDETEIGKPVGAGKVASDAKILPPDSADQKNLMLVLSRFQDAIVSAYEEIAPHKICAYIYELANAFNSFYHGTKILAQEDAAVRNSYLELAKLTKGVLETSIDLLGFSAPERM